MSRQLFSNEFALNDDFYENDEGGFEIRCRGKRKHTEYALENELIAPLKMAFQLWWHLLACSANCSPIHKYVSSTFLTTVIKLVLSSLRGNSYRPVT